FAGQELRLERVVGIEGVVADLDAGLPTEILDDARSHVVRPIVDVDDALLRLRGSRRHRHGGGCNKDKPDRSAHRWAPSRPSDEVGEKAFWGGSERLALRRGALQLSVGKPTSFHALMPPARWAS